MREVVDAIQECECETDSEPQYAYARSPDPYPFRYDLCPQSDVAVRFAIQSADTLLAGYSVETKDLGLLDLALPRIDTGSMAVRPSRRASPRMLALRYNLSGLGCEAGTTD